MRGGPADPAPAGGGPLGPGRLTGERPRQGTTPDSLLALHDAGYRAVVERLGPGPLLDVGCGEGFESARLVAEGRPVVGVDVSREATSWAASRFGAVGLKVALMDALSLGLADGAFAWACSSHLVEHFVQPEGHVAEVARVLADDGTAFVITPNAPADFENPFHVHLFGPSELETLLARHFEVVEVAGLDAGANVKADLARRRATARRVLALDVFDLRHKMPRRWYVAAYTRLLPVAYRLLARKGTGARTGITADDWFVTGAVDETTPVLFATCRRPRRAQRPRDAGAAGPSRPAAGSGPSDPSVPSRRCSRSG